MKPGKRAWNDDAETIVNFAPKGPADTSEGFAPSAANEQARTRSGSEIDPPTVMDVSELLRTAQEMPIPALTEVKPPEDPTTLRDAPETADTALVDTGTPQVPPLPLPQPSGDTAAVSDAARSGQVNASPSGTSPLRPGAEPDSDIETDRTNIRAPLPRPSEMDDIAWLVVVKSPTARLRQIFPLDAVRMELGRVPDTTICIDDRTVSSRHAAIRYEKVDERQEFVLYDLASTNGTFLNGAAVNRAVLQDDDRIRLGETELAFKRVGDAQTA